jgi:hypothetical protein
VVAAVVVVVLLLVVVMVVAVVLALVVGVAVVLQTDLAVVRDVSAALAQGKKKATSQQKADIKRAREKVAEFNRARVRAFVCKTRPAAHACSPNSPRSHPASLQRQRGRLTRPRHALRCPLLLL